MTDPDFLPTLRALAERITPGEWSTTADQFHPNGAVTSTLGLVAGTLQSTSRNSGRFRQEYEANAEFIALVRNHLPKILAMAEALEQADEALDQLLDDMGEDGQCVCPAAKREAQQALAATRAILAKLGGEHGQG